MALEELEKELYKKETDIVEKRRVKQQPAKEKPRVAEEWEKGKPRFMVRPEQVEEAVGEALEKGSRWSVSVLWSAAAVLAVITAVGGYYLYQSFNARGIGLTIDVPDQILIGKPFTLTVEIQNDSASVLNASELSLYLPSGTALLGQAPDKSIETRDTGSIGIGSITKQTFDLIILNGENTVKTFDIRLGYKSGTLSARFEKSVKKEISVGPPAIKLQLLASNKVFSGQNFEMTFSYENISGIDLSGLTLRAVYPPSFSFKSATLAPASGNDFWQLADLKAGSQGNVVVNGNVIGPDNSFFDLKIILTASFLGHSYDIAEQTTQLAISSSPLAVSILINDNADYIAKPGDLLSYNVSYRNNTDVGLRDVVLRMQLSGEMFDLASINTNGFVTSLNRTVTWNAANVPDFQLLPPRSQGSVRMAVGLKPDYPISRLNDKNFLLKADAQIESPTVPTFVGAERTIGIASLETKIGGRIDVNARAFFRDAASGILNKGPWPPKVDLPTQYTVHWEIKNYATDVSGVEVHAFLLAGVRWTGVVKSNIGTVPDYNDRTQEIVWKIPKISATRGVISEPIKATFQIEAVPSVNNIGRYMPLIGETSVRGLDEFTQLEISNTDFAIATDLPDDVTVGQGQGLVQQ